MLFASHKINLSDVNKKQINTCNYQPGYHPSTHHSTRSFLYRKRLICFSFYSIDRNDLMTHEIFDAIPTSKNKFESNLHQNIEH